MNKRILNIFLLVLFLFLGTPLSGANTDDIEFKFEAEIKKTGYIGEAFIYEVKLLSTSPEIANVRILQNPAFPTDMKILNGVVRNNRMEQISEKGKFKYSRVILRKYLIPSSSGKFSVGSGKFIVFIPHEKIVNRGFWGNTRMIDYEEARGECNSLDFKVNALPKKSDKFAGCVGEFKVESWFPPGAIYKGREAYAIFKISGYGSLENLKVPSLNKLFHLGCRLKEVEQNEEVMQRDGRLFSEVTLTCKFIPEEENFEIDALCMEFFNPLKKSYYDSCSERLQWNGNPARKKKNNEGKDAIAI